LQSAYKELGHGRGAFPLAESMADSLISLPIGPAMSNQQVAHVIESVLSSTMELSDV